MIFIWREEKGRGREYIGRGYTEEEEKGRSEGENQGVKKGGGRSERETREVEGEVRESQERWREK